MKNLFVILVLVVSLTLPFNALAFWSKAPDWKLDTVTKEEKQTTIELVKDKLAHPDSARFRDFWAVQGRRGDRYICGFVSAGVGSLGYERSNYIMFSVLADSWSISDLWSDNKNSSVFFGQDETRRLVLNICRERVIEK